MKHHITLQHLSLLLVMSISSLLHGAGYEWTNFVGKPGGEGNADGTGPAARFDAPTGVAVDGAGNVYVTDYNNHTIRKITPAAVVTTFAGKSGVYGHADGTGSQALFSNPSGIVIINGTIYVTDTGNSVIRKITSAGVVTTLAGKAKTNGNSDGTGEAARFFRPSGIAKAADGSLLVVDSYNQTLRKVTTTGVVTTLAGKAGSIGSTDGSLTEARFRYPSGIAVGAEGTIFISDTSNHTIRKITPAGVVSTLAGSAGDSGAVDGTGSAARFDYPNGLLVRPNGDLYVVDNNNSAIRRVTPAGEVTTIIGTMQQYGTADGNGKAARLAWPEGIAVDSAGRLYIADTNYGTIRRVGTDLAVTTFAGQAPFQGDSDGTGNAARFNRPQGISAAASGEVFIADSYNYKVRKATAGGVVTTHAGTGVMGSTDGPGATATFGFVFDTAVDATGNVYVTDYGHTVRKIDTMGQVSTVAGSAGVSGTTDGTGAAARFYSPNGIAVAADGTLYVADEWVSTIRKITPAGEVTTLAGQANARGYADATGAAARFNQPTDVAVDADGYVYVADSNNNRIRKISPAGKVTTVAGSGAFGYADGFGTEASFRSPTGVSIDAYGNLIVCDSLNHTIRRITPTGVVTTIGGSPLAADGKDGADSDARFSRPMRAAIDSAGVIYVVEFANNRVMKGVPHPEIAVEEPVGTELKDAAAVIDYDTVSIHEDVVRTFTITNRGGLPLTGLSVNLTGTHAADFLVDGVKSTLNPGQSTTFTVTYQGNITGLRTAALQITSNDADEATFDINLKVNAQDMPFVTTAPVSQVLREGDTVMMTSLGSHPTATVTYQWLKNGTKISGATSANYQKTGIKVTDAGTYTVEMKTNGFIVRRNATLVVAKYLEQTHVVKIGAALKLSAITSGPATYAWTLNHVPIAGTSATMNVNTAVFGSATYRCQVSGPGGGSVLAGVFTVSIYDGKPVVFVQNLPHGAVGATYTHQIKINTNARYAPTRYSATGLPTGVTLNTTTGLISGVPTLAKNYDIIVTASNLYDTVAAAKETITISPLPTGVIGSFIGMVKGKGFLGSALNGRIDFTCASTGVITGSTVIGTTKRSFTGKINTDGAQPISTITVPQGSSLPLILNLIFTPGMNALDATSSLSSGISTASITAWRQVWRTSGPAPLNPATATAKRYNFALDPAVIAGLPEGNGFGSFTLTTNGTLTVTGKTPEGDTFTTAGFAGPHGQILVYQSLYAANGQLIGLLDIDALNTGTLTDILTGDLSWTRPANAASRNSPNGFSKLTLTAYGARYTQPTAPALILGMGLGDKALIDFSGGGLGSASINPNVAAFDIIAGNKAVMPALKDGNPGNVKFVTLNAATGEFSGTFTLSDNELRTGAAFVGKKFPRTVTFTGLLTQDNLGPVGAGYFLLPELPTDTTAPTKTLIRSGYVQLQKK